MLISSRYMTFITDKETKHVHRNHANQLVHTGALGSCFGMILLNDLYCAALFLKMGTHLLRIDTCLFQFLRSNNVRVRPGVPPAADKIFVEQIKDPSPSANRVVYVKCVLCLFFLALICTGATMCKS